MKPLRQLAKEVIEAQMKSVEYFLPQTLLWHFVGLAEQEQRLRFVELIRCALKVRIDDGRMALSFTHTEWESIANALAAPEAREPAEMIRS